MAEDINNSLFSQDELDSIQSAGYSRRPKGPVTVLGRTFNNDEERRAFFREELRKKLPELKKIEGYPVGSDDNIIALSDPPFYTACPNPWLNDFIAEWEKEKVQLEKEGKRKADFEVKEPYASDVSEGKNNPVYLAHSYHTKVPHTAIEQYLKHFTQPGDIVLDGFCGTGMTGAACRLYKESSSLNKIGGRHAILGDLSPYASIISYYYNRNINPSFFIGKVKNALENTKKRVGWMYETNYEGTKCRINYTVWSDVLICTACGSEMVFWDVAKGEERGETKDFFTCPYCGAVHTKRSVEKKLYTHYDSILKKSVSSYSMVPVMIQFTDAQGRRHTKAPDEEDLSLIKNITETQPVAWVPKELFLGKGERWGHTWRLGNHVGITHVHQFFTYRNLIVLAVLREELMKTNCLHTFAVFTSILQSLCSKLTRYNGGKRGNGSQPLTLYIGSLMAESNVLKVAEGKIADFAKAMELLFDKEDNSNVISCSSATSIYLNDNSIDYIFTDPPFGENIVYSELNFMTESWLKVKTDNTDEAIEESSQNKGLKEYELLMESSFKEYYRVLKPSKWMSVVFSNTSASVWNAIQMAMSNAGFIIASVSSLDKKQGSFNAVSSTTAVKQDLVITCYKPSDELSSQFELQMNRKDVVWDFIQEHMEHLAVHVEKGSKTTTVIERSPKILYDRLISYYVQHGLPVPMDAQEFQQGLRERFVERDGMFFTAVQAAEYEEKRKHTDGFAPMGIIVSDEANGIEWLKNQLRESPKTYQQIQPEWMQAINGLRKGDILPELKTLLEENFIEEPDGRWRLPNIQDDVDKNLLRTKALLKEFNLYKEQALKPKAKLKEVRVEALRAGFKQCYIDKDFQAIVTVAEKIPQNLRDEDEVLLQFYDIAMNKL